MTKIEKVQSDIITYLPSYIVYDESLGPVVLSTKNVILDEVDPSTYTGKININLVLDREEKVAESIGGSYDTKEFIDIYVVVGESTRANTYKRIKEINAGFKSMLEDKPNLFSWNSTEYYPNVEGSNNLRALKISIETI